MIDAIQQPQLKSPKMVAAVLSSCYRYQPSREVVKRRREQFERGLSDSCLLAKNCRMHRNRSADSFRSKHLNEAQRLVKYRSSSSLLSLDSGVCSHEGSTNTSSEDLRPPLSRSASNDRIRQRPDNRRTLRATTSFSLTSSSPEPKTPEVHNQRGCHSPRYSKCASSSPDLSALPDLLQCPPPLPPKTRPPLPPRRRPDSGGPPPTSSLIWDADSEGSSDISLTECPLVDQCGDDGGGGVVRGQIPATFVFRDPLQRFLTDLGQTSCSEVTIHNVTGSGLGLMSLRASTTTIAPAAGLRSTKPLPESPSRTEVQVLFRTGGLARLEEQRDAVLAGTITRLQAQARGVLARRRLQKRKVQETAIKCVQKNVRKFLGVREWPWWRLLVRLTPLLDVHRTEHQLREAKGELETLRARFDKVEKEKTSLQQTNDKLEGRLSEVVADLAEEHSTAQLAGERLEAEQADRMRLEKELDNAQNDMRELSVATERLESEKSALRTEMLQHATSLNNGDLTEHDDASSASLYKRKFEWSQREVESLKQQLRQHQQDEHEQTGLLKKQLEKKVGDAREEAEEHRQVGAQLKKRTQRLQAEMNDLKILLEEQTARNILLEKKQRKFDSELAAGQDELRVERLNKEKVVRERDAHLAEKYAVDQELSTLKLELELRDERVSALTKQLEELSFAGQGDAEITLLRKGKHTLESKIKDQEEELDDLAGQVQVLEGARTRLEMSIEQLRKETRLEGQQRDEELEEVRCAAQKKVKALEAQVEAEHEERTQLVREKHELERRLLEMLDRSSVAPDDDTVHRLKKDLRKTKALLKDTQTMLEKSQSEGPSKLIIRQLKTQLEDCEFAKTAALKARQSADADLSEMQSTLDDAQRARKEADDRYSRLLKEKTELQTQLEEGEELHAETLKKYKSTVSQISVDQITLSEQSQRVAELEQERQVLSDRLQELSSKVEVLEGETANIHTQRMLQMKVKELESKLELELATRKRIESQMTRLKEQLERLSGECDLAKLKEAQSADQCKKMSRQLRQSKEEGAMTQQRNTELSSKKQEQEKQMELMDSEISTLKSDLKLAFKRIEDLQMALQGDISDSDSDLSDSESDSDTSLTSYLTSSARASRSASASARLPNRTPASPTNRGEDSMSPGSDAMAIIEEAREEAQHSESFA